jgi:DegV family protein with EDD domain
MIKIVADSTCNLSDEVIEQYDLRIAPISIQFGQETYEEGIDIDREFFYNKIEELGIIPTSSQPSPAWFAKHYEELHAHGHSILVITITRKHSGTFESAIMAKSMTPDADVEVFDSSSISLGTGWMVLEAAQMVEQGASLPQMLRRLEAIRSKSRLYLTPLTLKYLQMSGRVGRLQSAVASMLKVKPIIVLEEGTLEVGENVRTRSKALTRLVELLEDHLGRLQPVNLAVMHALAEADARWLIEKAQETLNVNEFIIDDIVPSLAVHGGPGVIGIFGYPVEMGTI